MSKHVDSRRITVPEIRARKGREKIVSLTAYTAPMAAILDQHVDLLLVGDSLGMVIHGLPNTVGVTLDMMILHGQAVVRAPSHALVVIDPPFGTYESGRPLAFSSATRIMRYTGWHAAQVAASAGLA